MAISLRLARSDPGERWRLGRRRTARKWVRQNQDEGGNSLYDRMLTMKPDVLYQSQVADCPCRRESAMEGFLAELGWLVAGGTLGIVLMALMFIAKDSGDPSEDRKIAEDGSGGVR